MKSLFSSGRIVTSMIDPGRVPVSKLQDPPKHAVGTKRRRQGEEGFARTSTHFMKIQLIAHRGIWDASVPQNTLEAFRRAWADGATWVETDFHHAKSGQMICIHAEGELRKYTGCEKAIADLTPDEVASLRLDPARFANGGVAPANPTPEVPFRIPFLHEVLATVPPHGTLQAEIKGYSAEYADLFDRAVRDAGLAEDNIVVSSFHFEALADFHRRYPAYRTLLLLGVPKDGDRDVLAEIARARDAGFDFFCPGLTPNDRSLTADELAAVRASGMGFRVYGVNRPEDLRRARDAGAGAFTCNFWHQAFDWAKDIGCVELLR